MPIRTPLVGTRLYQAAARSVLRLTQCASFLCLLSFSVSYFLIRVNLNIIGVTFLLFAITSIACVDCFAGISADKVGLAVTQSMSMTSLLQWGIRHSCEVANQLISVERILEYSDLEPEKQPDKHKDVDQSWPSGGRIQFRDVTFKYAYETEPALKRISFEVLPKNKICVVGRTGAGKSSLIGALFRMAYVKGEIIIDDVDTSTIQLQLLRSKISIIPQTPLLFSGTLRQ